MEVDKRAVQLTMSLSSFLTPWSGSSFNIALPSIAKEYGLTAVAMSWASLAYLLTSAMFLIPFGKLADMHGRKKVYLAGITVFTAASALLAVHPSSELIVAYRALQGVGSAMIFGTGVAILVSVHEPQERGTVLGVNVACVYIALSVGPYLGGFLTKNYGWRSIFLLNVALGLVVIAVTLLKVKAEWKIDGERGFDLKGSAAYSLMLMALTYGMSNLPATTAYIPILVGLVLLAAFIWIEDRAQNPVLDLRLFRENKAFSYSNLAALINYSATFAMTLLLSMYLQYIKALDPQQAGAVMMASPIVQAIVSPIAGRLSDTVQPHRLATAGMAVTSASLVPLIFVTDATSLTYIAASLGLLGVGLALFSSPNTNAIMGSVDSSRYGVASSTVGTMRLTGQMVSTGIAMTVFAVNLGAQEIAPALYPQLLQSIKTCFIVFLVLCIPGVLASNVRSRLSA
ncbi:MFS transporter [Candidatus Bathyarchaeota archaeon]|nr:MFS transporter [Candidatus Bathyarchaeota archaeon]